MSTKRTAATLHVSLTTLREKLLEENKDNEPPPLVEIPTASSIQTVLRTAFLSDEWGQNEIVCRICKIVTAPREILPEDFSQEAHRALKTLLQKKVKALRRMRIIYLLLNLICFLGMLISYFAIGKWSSALGFVGICVVTIKSIYYLLNFWDHRHRVSPVLIFLVTLIALGGIGFVLGWKVSHEITKESDDLSDLSSSVDISKNLIDYAYQDLANLEDLIESQSQTGLNSSEVLKRLNKAIDATEAIYQANRKIEALATTINKAMSSKVRICDFVNQLLVLIFPLIEFLFGLITIW